MSYGDDGLNLCECSSDLNNNINSLNPLVKGLINLHFDDGNVALCVIRENLMKFKDILEFFNKIEQKCEKDSSMIKKYSDFLAEKS